MKKNLIPGLILSIVMGLTYILSLIRVFPQNGWGWAMLLLYFIVFFLLLKWVKRKYYFNDISFQTLFKNGVLIGLFSVVVVSSSIYIYLQYIDSSPIEKMTQIAEEQKQKDIEERGPVSPAYEKAYKFGLTAVGQSVSQLDNILLWLLFSLISAAILKTKNPNTEVEESKM